MTAQELLLSARTLRQVARHMFDPSEPCLGSEVPAVMDLSVRDSGWVHVDSFDAGVVAAAVHLLQVADSLEAAAYLVHRRAGGERG